MSNDLNELSEIAASLPPFVVNVVIQVAASANRMRAAPVDSLVRNACLCGQRRGDPGNVSLYFGFRAREFPEIPFLSRLQSGKSQ